MFLEDMTGFVFELIKAEYFDNMGIRNVGIGVLVSHVGLLYVYSEQFVVLFYYFCPPKLRLHFALVNVLARTSMHTVP
jgi:hypothetical protein